MQIAKAVDDEVVARDLVPSFIKLLKDTEAEVRTAIAGQIPGTLMLKRDSSSMKLTVFRFLRPC